MSIDLQLEELLTLTDATKALPRLDGKRLHPSTIFRWCKDGLRGVKLEYVRLGHRICTSREALSRFARLLAEADGNQPPKRLTPTRTTRTPAQRCRDVDAAKQQMAKAGI